MAKSALKQSNSTTSSSSSSSSSDVTNILMHKKSVYFGDLHIREFPLILGDNPNCEGAPLMLDWTPVHETVVDVDFYEYTRDPRRSRRKMKMPAVDREVYLLTLGYGINKVLEIAQEGREIREQRTASYQSKKWDRFNIVFESARSGMKNAVKFNAPKQPEHSSSPPRTVTAKSA